MIKIEHKVMINKMGVEYNIGLSIVIEFDVANDMVNQSIEMQSRAIREAIYRVLLGNTCEHHPSEKVIGAISLEPICNQCIRES